jgi:hypothetical protein
MPITQSRLLAMVEIAEGLVLQIEHMRTVFHREAQDAHLGEQTHAKAIDNIEQQWFAIFASLPIRQIAVERAKYNMTHARNERVKRYMQRDRAGQTPRRGGASADGSTPDLRAILAEAERQRDAGIVPKHRQTPAKAKPRTAAEIAAAVDSEDTSMFGDSDVQAWTPHKSDGDDNK